MSCFFISYSRKETDIANKIRDHISRLDSSHDVFLDTTSIKVGVNWKDELERKIKQCDYFIYIHSENTLASKYVNNELKWVEDSELKTGLRKMIVYRIGHAPLIPAIANYQILDASDNFAVDFHRLMQGIYAENSFYSIQYEIELQDKYWYKGKVWVEAPKNFLNKIQMVEYRLDYGWADPIKTFEVTKTNKLNCVKKFEMKFETKYHFTLFAMIYLWNTKELAFVKRIHISH